MAEYPAGCIVVSKQQEKAGKRRENKQRTFERPRRLGEQKGLRTQAFPELSDLAPRENSQPLVVGPVRNYMGREACEGELVCDDDDRLRYPGLRALTVGERAWTPVRPIVAVRVVSQSRFGDE